VQQVPKHTKSVAWSGAWRYGGYIRESEDGMHKYFYCKLPTAQTFTAVDDDRTNQQSEVYKFLEEKRQI
jgi:hypothetical protein